VDEGREQQPCGFPRGARLIQFAGLTDRLGFLLPEFARVSWINDSVQRTWAPRFRRIRTCWRETEWRSVADGIRDCALISEAGAGSATEGAPWSRAGLSAELLDPVGSIASKYKCWTNLTKTSERALLVIGRLDRVRQLRQAVASDNHDEIGRLLGYPDCCRRAFIHVRIELEFADVTWAMIPASPCDLLKGPIETNIFWRQIGIRLVPHLPCGLDCPQSLQLATAMSDAADRYGFGTEVAWTKEILSWPLQWSGLHGIAEIKTPVLRLCTRTDATASKYSLSWHAHDCGDGATVVPLSQLVTGSKGVQNGLKRTALTTITSPTSNQG